ncbi:MAG: membrane protease YdiL (CAAX protease family) [Maricaulis sp.]|jgi:membrane protease YdiL (CAAX protease family)
MTKRISSFASPWNFWHGLAILAFAMTAYAALSWAHMAIIEQTIGIEAYLGDGPRLPPSVMLAGQINKAIALMGVLWLGGMVTLRLPLKAVGLVAVSRGWIALAIIIGGLAFIFRLGLAKLFVIAMPGWLDMVRPPFAFDPGFGPVAIAGFLVMAILITPFVEEVFFRGFLFKWMAGHRPVWLAALVSSILFGIAHILPPQAISAALMALVLCWLYWRTGSIWPAIAAHVTNNAIGILLGAAAAAGGLPAWLTP